MDEYEEALSQDPIIGPLLRRLQAAEQRAAATEEQTKRTTMAMIAKIKIEQMQQLKQQYPHVDEEQLWQAAAAKAQQWQQHGPNMDDVHLLMTFDERVRQAGQAAFEKGR